MGEADGMLAYPVLICTGTRLTRLQMKVEIGATAIFSCSYVVSVCVLLSPFYFHNFILFDVQANAAVCSQYNQGSLQISFL